MNEEMVKLLLCQIEEYRQYVHKDLVEIVKELFGEMDDRWIEVQFIVHHIDPNVCFDTSKDLGWKESLGVDKETRWIESDKSNSNGSTTFFARHGE